MKRKIIYELEPSEYGGEIAIGLDENEDLIYQKIVYKNFDRCENDV